MGEVTLQTTVIFRGFAPVPRCKTRTCIDDRLGKGENYALTTRSLFYSGMLEKSRFFQEQLTHPVL